MLITESPSFPVFDRLGQQQQHKKEIGKIWSESEEDYKIRPNQLRRHGPCPRSRRLLQFIKWADSLSNNTNRWEQKKVRDPKNATEVVVTP